MRQVLLGVVIAFAAGSAASASSIEVIGKSAPVDSGSIITTTCQTCPPLAVIERKKDYTVPSLPQGELQSSQVRDIGGEKKLYRTEGWMGGSPIVFVTKAPIATMTASAPVMDGIDRTETTSVVIGSGARPVAAGMAGQAPEQKAPLDVSTFKLRQ